MSLGTGEDGSNGGAMKRIPPFSSTNAWNTNISSAALDPNSATLASTFGPLPEATGCMQSSGPRPLTEAFLT